MIELMRLTGGFHTVDDMVQACSQPGGMNKNLIARMNERLKGTTLHCYSVLHCPVLHGTTLHYILLSYHTLIKLGKSNIKCLCDSLS
jgi:hypothetical protein